MFGFGLFWVICYLPYYETYDGPFVDTKEREGGAAQRLLSVTCDAFAPWKRSIGVCVWNVERKVFDVNYWFELPEI